MSGSVLDGESGRVYNKTLNGLDSLGDTEVGDLTVTGDLLVEGGTSLEGGLDMNNTRIIQLADGVAATDAVNLSQLTGAGSAFLKLDGTTTMDLNADVKLNAGDVTGATDITCTGTVTGANLAGTVTTAVQNSITGLGGVTTLSMNTNKITSVADGTATTDAVNLGQLTTTTGLFLPLAGGTMDASADITLNAGDVTGATDITCTGTVTGANLAGTLTTAAQPNITSVGNLTALNINTQYNLPTATSTGGFLLGINPANTAQLTFQDPTAIEDSVWKEITAGSAYDTAVLRGTQGNQAVSIGYDTAALPTADLVRLFVNDTTNAVITRNQSATIQTDVISTTTFGQIKADNATGAGTSAPLFVTGRGGVNLQHILPADGAVTTITTTTQSSFNTQANMSIGAGFTAEPESSIVAQGPLNNANPTQKGVHLGDVSDFGVVQLAGSNGGTVEFTDQTESGTTSFNSRIFYDNVGQPTNFDLVTWTNRPTGQSTSYEWLAGCGNVVLNVFQGLNFYNPSSAPTTEYSIGREPGVWSSPFPSLYQSWGTGMKFVTNAAIGAQATFKWYFDNAGTTPQVEISNGGKIASSYNPMIYASGVTTAAGTGFLRQRNTTSISLTATGQYTITLAITMPSSNYGVTISPEASASVGFVFNKTTTTFDVVTYISGGGVATLSFSYAVIDFE